ncbi:MAG: beta-galactosidase trimerization domain-containing protein [Candidatus Hydrogenedentes bacterium]|nr:beta-galactosidase trimerization domain-containing protein [Candidatus Hydrogenedentota bacterium]
MRVVFLAPYSAHHDTFELMQRFDIDGRVVPVSGPGDVREIGIPGHYWPGLLQSRERVLDEVRRAVTSDWEAVVMCGVPEWHRYPEDIRMAIADGVASGRGLIVSEMTDTLAADLTATGAPPEPMNPGLVLGADADWADPIGCYAAAEGRVYCFSESNDNRFGYLLSRSELQAEFERTAARAGWVIRHAARPDSAVLIGSVSARADAVAVQVGDTGLIAGAQLAVAVRNRASYALVVSDTKQAAAGTEVRFPLPYCPTGAYQAEARLCAEDGQVFDWKVATFDVARSVTALKVQIENPVAAPGDIVRCLVSAQGPVAEMKVAARWYDAWQRLIDETPLRPYAESFSFTAPDSSRSVLNRLEVRLVSERGTEAVASGDVLMPANVRQTDFHVLYWNTGLRSSWRSRLQCEALRERGMADAFSNCPRSAAAARAAAHAHLRVVPYTTAFHKVQLASKLLNEEWLAELEAGAQECAREVRAFGALGYTLGDENYVDAFTPEGRLADTPEGWAAFQAYLQTVYPDLATLNAQWNTEFGEWDTIRFENEQAMLPDLENPSAWCDYRMFVSASFAAAHQRMRRAIHEVDPNAPVGWDGCEQYSSYDGYDWWQMTRGMGLINVYHTYLVLGWLPKVFNGEAVKSFRPEAAVSGCWLNHADRRYGGTYVTWYLCLNGWNSAWWWHATFPHPANGALTWDLQPTPIVADMARAADAIKRGPATLLAHAQKQIDPIAVHYSENNWHASTIESGVGNHVNNLGTGQCFWMADNLAGRSVGRDDEEMRALWGSIVPKGHYAAAAGNMHYLLRDLGFQAQTIARQEIEAGALERKGIRCLMLPFVVSLSDSEVERIRAFVSDGGLLIADYRCGLRDLHCRMRPEPALDDVFGLRRAGADVIRGRSAVTFDYAEGVGARVENVFHEPLTAAGARAHGCQDDGTPAFFIHSFGEGRAVYLNSDLYTYGDLRRHGQEGDLRELIRALLIHEADLFAPFVVESRHGHPVSHTEVTRFREGRARYFGVLNDFAVDDKRPMDVRLPFPPGLHVYDIRAQEYLGPAGAAYRTLAPGSASLYAALPHAVAGVSLTCPERALRGERVEVGIRVVVGQDAVGPVSPHAVRITVRLPNGSTPEYLKETVYAGDGTAVWAFTPALNAALGSWSIEAEEVASGLSVRRRVSIFDRNPL